MTEDQISHKAIENLDLLERMFKESSIYWTFTDGEKKIGEFDPEKLPKQVPSPFKQNDIRFEFELFDIKKGKVKYWSVSPSIAKELYRYLREGFRTLEIERVGTGLQTRWKINPVIEEERKG